MTASDVNSDSSAEQGDTSLGHSEVPEAHSHTNRKEGDRMSGVSHFRKHAFKVIIPIKVSGHTNSDLKLMLVSLKNARDVASVYISKIERELKKRDCKPAILGQ
ncbi:MAG: hypothetical protein ACFE7R_08405 [Candidatus Hodarchaeota archaeon]